MGNNLINLENNEKILAEGQSNPNMVDKQYSRMILMGIVLVIIWIVLIISYKEKPNMETTGFIVITFLITIAVVYAFIYSAILIKKRENEVYYVTNKRIFIVKGNTTLEKNILDIEHIGISKEKNEYGNIVFSFYGNSLYESTIKTMSFVGIHYPRKIVQTITEINNKIHVYDDKPQGIFAEKEEK